MRVCAFISEITLFIGGYLTVVPVVPAALFSACPEAALPWLLGALPLLIWPLSFAYYRGFAWGRHVSLAAWRLAKLHLARHILRPQAPKPAEPILGVESDKAGA